MAFGGFESANRNRSFATRPTRLLPPRDGPAGALPQDGEMASPQRIVVEGTITTTLQQWDVSNPSSQGVSESQRLATAYCLHPLVGTDTIDGMLDSRPPLDAAPHAT
jgi:hypothetical protein